MPKAGDSADGNDWRPDGWLRGEYPHGDHAHAFYEIDRGGTPAKPSVLLLHEFPGISDNLVALANVLADDFRVVVPSILGRDGRPGAADSVRQLCVRREVHLFARDGVSRDARWLRDFADQHVAQDGNRYGVIGMCFSGNFALALAVDKRVAAAVVAQPAIPVVPCALGLSFDDRQALRERTDLRVQGYRFRRDPTSPAAKLTAAENLLGTFRMQVFQLSEPNDRKHSTLTGGCRNEQAITGVRSFLRERLSVPG
jgi:dienelactone hydrolase